MKLFLVLTLKKVALELGLLAEQEFNEWVVPGDMIGPMKYRLYMIWVNEKKDSKKSVNDVTLFKSYITLIRLMLLNLVLSKSINAYKLKKKNQERE